MRLDFCVACGHDMADELHHHHLVPRSRGGPDEETNLVTLCVECHGLLHGVEWQNNHAQLTKAGLAAAKARGQKLGNADLAAGNKAAAAERADALRAVFSETADLSLRAAAEVLNSRGVATPTGKQWGAMAVARVRARLAAA